MTNLDETLLRGVEKIYPSRETLEKSLKSGKKLKIYFGIDPTSTSIHLGHSIPLRKLRRFQDLGHNVVLLFGDFTALIGDPSAKSSMRQPLDSDQVEKNVSTYKEKAAKILEFDLNPPEVLYNSKWWDKMDQKEFFKLLSRFTVSQLLERSMFQERIKKGRPISISEFLYPVLQGWDSVAMGVDMEIGASDQTFNMLVGRQLVSQEKKKEKFVLTTPLLEGTDGRKMSKSYGNTIDITDSPNDMYGKIMSLHDDLVIKYFHLTTSTPGKEISDLESKLKKKDVNPMKVKKLLAFELVKTYHGEGKAESAEKEFETVFQKGGKKSEIDTVTQARSILPTTYASVSTSSGATSSISEAVRLAEGGGLRFDGKVVQNAREPIPEPKEETIIDIGKRKSLKIIWKDT